MEKEFQKQINQYAQENQYGVSFIPAHIHDGVGSLQIDPVNLLGFPTIGVSSATTAPTDTPTNGTIRFYYDGTNYVQWDRVNNTWVGTILFATLPNLISLTTGVSGILPQANGGTGASTLLGALFITNDLTAQSAAIASVVTTTAPNDGVSHQYNIGGYITITAISVNTISLQVDYTDETSASRTQSFFPEGLTSAALATTGAFGFPPMTIRAKQNTAITVKTVTVGAGSQTYDCGGNIMRIN